MNLDQLRALNTSILGSGYTLAETASKIQSVAYEEADAATENLDAISQFISSVAVEATDFDLSDARELDEFLENQTDKAVSMTTATGKSITIQKVLLATHELGDTYGFQLNGENMFEALYNGQTGILASIQNVQFKTPTKYADGSDMDETFVEFISDLITGIQLPCIFTDLCQVVKENSEIDASSLVTITNSTIGNRLRGMDSIKNNLLSAASSGASTLISAITNIYVQTKSFLEDTQQSGSADLNSTSFEVQRFSWGIVGGMLVNLGQVVAGALAAIGGVVGVILALTSAALNTVKNIFQNVMGAATDTAFISAYPTGSASFNVVLDEYYLASSPLFTWLASVGSKVFTVNSPHYPCILIGYITDTGTLHIQELPSVNFSFVNDLYDYDTYHIYIDYNKYAVIKHLPGSHYNSNTGPNIMWGKSLFENNNLFRLIDSCYNPISLDFSSYIDSLKDFTNATMLENNANIYCERLLTSIILWALTKNGTWMLNVMENKFWEGIEFLTGEYALDYSSGEGRQYKLLSKASNLYAAAFFYNNSYNQEIHFGTSSGGVQDSVVSLISEIFNDLYWRNYDVITDKSYMPTSYFGYSSMADLSDSGAVSSDIAYSSMVIYYTAANYDHDLLQGYTFPDSLVFGSDCENASPVLLKQCAIKVPRALMSGVILGILADVLILAVLAVATVFTVKLALKVKNKVRKNQAKVEALWYEYEDRLVDGSSLEDQEAAWKAYKSARFKYNISAFLSGGTTLGLGLYDDGSSAPDVVTPVIEGISGITPDSPEYSEDPININSIVQLIKG